MRPLNSIIKLRWTFWVGPLPQSGDGLETRTGRRYLILQVRGHTLHCQVIAPGEAVPGTCFRWQWNARPGRVTQLGAAGRRYRG